MLKVNPIQFQKSLIKGLLLSLLLTSCTSSASTATPIEKPVELTVAQVVESAPVNTPVESQNSTVSQGTPTFMPPAANRQQPEDWRDWPVIPIPSARARQIYQLGIAAGTDPTRVSKVGDCQAIQEVLLGRYDKEGGYTLRENQQALMETIQQFAGSFARDGEAVQGGFNAASELSPLWSNPDTCEPGETPLECEIRVHNPSIVLISLEVWWDGRSADVYVKNMRQIIDLAISKGILPILSTKADNVEGDHSINLATARLAYEYDLPLWNWWKAAQSLPNHGLDPDRPDGFHISQASWDERSFTALQSIDAVWRGTRGETSSLPATPQPVGPATTPESGVCSINITPGADCADTSVSANPTLTINTGITPITDAAVLTDPAGVIYLSVARRSGETVTSQGVFAINPTLGTALPLLPPGSGLQATSQDGKQILYNRGSELIQAMLDGSQHSTITNNFVDQGTTAAGWQADGKGILFLTQEDGKTLLAQYPLDGSTAWKRLSSAADNPVEIYPAPDPGRIFWENAVCQSAAACTRSGVHASGLDGSSLETLPGILKAAFSPDGRWLVYEERVGDNQNLLSLSTTDLKDRRKLENIGNQFLDYSWSPDGSKLSILTLDRSDYSGLWIDTRSLVINTNDMGTKILPPVSGVNPRAVWSPDGSSLLLTSTQQTAAGYTIQMQVMDISTSAVRTLTLPVGFSSNDFIYTTRIHWVKAI